MAEQPESKDELRPPETPIDPGSQALSEALRSSFGIVKLVMVLLVLVFFGSGFFTVGPQEQGMIIRLGRPVGEGKAALLGPGLHYAWPYPIDEFVKVPITAIQKVTSTVGWYATTPEQEAAGTEMPVGPNSPMNPLVDGYVLTADNNILHTRATLTYHIAEPIVYVFSFVNASNAVQKALDNALLYAGSRFNVDDILTHERVRFQEEVRRRTVALVESQNLGIVVEECQVQSRAPRQLKDAFDNVIRAEVTRDKLVRDALTSENQVLSRASADAQALINSAEADRTNLVNEVRSQADRFNDLLPKFRQNPSLFAEKRLTETLGRVFTNSQDKIFVTTDTGAGAFGDRKELRLQFNRERPKPKAKEEGKP
jgi:membrane protease subunit HflK